MFCNNEIKMKVINAMQRWKDRWKNYTVGRRYHEHTQWCEDFAVLISYQSPPSYTTMLKWTQSNDENDPDKRNCIYSDPSHMRKRENVEETACRRHEMIWRWSYGIKRNQKKNENSFKK